MTRLVEFLRLANRPCADMTALISAALDELLPWSQRWAYRLHVLYCRSCRRFLRQVRQMRAALRGLAATWLGEGPGSGPELPADARTRIATRLAAAAGKGSAGS